MKLKKLQFKRFKDESFGTSVMLTLQARTLELSITFYPSFPHSLVTNTDRTEEEKNRLATFKEHLF